MSHPETHGIGHFSREVVGFAFKFESRDCDCEVNAFLSVIHGIIHLQG